MAQDLLLNLIAEMIGIIVTVLIIDRMIQRREQKRWLPSKHYVHARLFEIIDNFLDSTFPPRFTRLTKTVYEYGRVTVFAKTELDETMPPTLYSDTAEALRLRKHFDIEIVSRAKQGIDAILDRQAFLLDPELLTPLFSLDRGLMALMQTSHDWEKEKVRTAFGYDLHLTVEAALDVRARLESMADRRRTFDEWRQGLDEILRLLDEQC